MVLCISFCIEPFWFKKMSFYFFLFILLVSCLSTLCPTY
uniref:Uncharacterized protein n=1 Tax=Rhizophora mucronata TaxID=61149 RepID=A0A2P2Q142_RHIMU